MAHISMDRLNEIDKFVARAFTEKPWGEDPIPLFNLAIMAGQLDQYAQKLTEHFGVSREELDTYITLEGYCHDLANGCYMDEDFPCPETVA